jgi:hypothetical protein
MKRQFQLWPLPVAIAWVAIMVTAPTQCAYARGRAGGFPHGGFSREGPAAAGSFASRSGSMAGHGGEANRMDQGNRMAYGEHAQASRQQEANSLQSNREQTAKALQNNAQQYRGNYPYAGAGYPAWDAGAGLAAAATGAAIGAAATASSAAQAIGPAAYAAGQPCANAVTVPVGQSTFFRCGSAWYREAYGPAGPTFVPVGSPGQ